MFVWRADAILKEIQRQMPAFNAVLRADFAAWGTPQQDEVLKSVWPTLKSETID